MGRAGKRNKKRNAKGELIFVYNMDTGLMNDIRSLSLKFIRPQDHSCQLVYLTWGILGLKAEWERYLQRLPYSTYFMHRDVFVAQFPHRRFHPLPAIFIKANDSLYQIISQQDLLETTSLAQLEKLMKQKLKDFTVPQM